MHAKRNAQALSRNQFYRERTVIPHIPNVSLALATQHAKRTCRITLSPAACLAVPYFSTVSHKRHDFPNELLNTKYVLVHAATFFFLKYFSF
jgi:hypothetical protein